MVSGYRFAGDIPWNDLSQHISLGNIQQDGFHFAIQTPVDLVERRSAILRVVNAVVRSIESRLEEKSTLIPRPDASQRELRFAGVVVDGDLFPPDIVKHPKTMRHPPRLPINRIDSWNSATFASLAHIGVVLHALSTPDDPFTHLPVLAHLAQRPRTRFLAAQLASFGKIGDPPGQAWSVIEEYIRLTSRQYIFLNILLALDQHGDCFENDRVRKMACFPHTSGTFSIGGYLPLNVHSHSEPLAIKVSNKWFPLDGDKLHNYFWSLTHEDNTRRECVPAWREQYIQRCFDVMAVWYALSKEASKTYDALQSQKSDHTFNIMSLFEMVLDAFTSLGDAFHIQRGPLDDFSRQYYAATVREVEALEEVAPVTAAFPISIPVPVKGFLDLPPELHFQIVSYLPLHDLISLSMVCRAIRPQCVVSIFRDPLSVLGELSTGSFDYKIYRRFQSMLEARPHLLHHVRRYTGYYNFLPLDPITSSGRYNEMRLAKGVDIRSPLASQLSYLRWAELNLWNLEYWRQDPDKAIHHALQLAQKCWPDLQSLELKIYQECQSISPIADHNTSELAGDCGKVGCFCGPPNWRLRQLSITAHAYRDLLGIQLVTLPPVPLSSLLQGCAATLTRLKLDLPAAAFGDIRSIPDLFCLSYLSLPSNLSAPDIDIFLSHCPNLSSLEFGPWDWSEAILDTRLDLFGCSNLEILHLHRTPYTISRLPESMRTVNAEMHSLLPLKLEVHNPVQASVFTLRLTLELDTRSRTIGALLDLLAPLSKEYPKLSLLELKMQGFYHGTDDQLVRIAKCASDQFPLLQTLILNWREFENNPRRIDFPAADSGQEERERRIVQWMFSECGSLNVVALTGVPPLVQDNPYVHPRMVWAKTVDEEGNVNAVRTGRTAIRWVDETNVL